MDPISGIVAVFIVAHMLKGLPGALANIAEALNDDSAASRARLKRLLDAGVAPSTAGSRLRRALANAWREAVLDAEARHAARAARRAAAGKAPSWWQRNVAAATARWRTRHTRPVSGSGGGPVNPHTGQIPPPGPDLFDPPGPELFDPPRVTVPPDTGPTYGSGDGGGSPGPELFDPRPVTVPHYTTDGDYVPRPPLYTTATVGEHGPGGGWGEPVLVGAAVGPAALEAGAGLGQPVTPPSGPAPLVVGPAGPPPELAPTALPEPTTTPLAIGGTTTMSNAVEVTGVSSGAAAAASLAQAIQAATDDYVAQLLAFQRQIAAMAEQAHGNVQLGTHSHVLDNLAQAHEAAAAAMGQATRVSAEVVPLLHQVRRSYLAIH